MVRTRFTGPARAGWFVAVQDCEVTPQVGDDDMIWLRQSLKSDATGIVRVEHALPGLSYRFQAHRPANEAARAAGGPFFQVYDKAVVLIPKEPK